MRQGKERKGFWRSTIGLVTDNWGLKILALILAVLMYYTIKYMLKSSDKAPHVPSELIKFEKVEPGS